ncbi:hypothetical protein [Rhodovulum euryhalinum]|uniref:Uncharacterized protein n=1 Tax=Rhodovulum euryhalinum TaxID=35805 RepID=A0A4R2KG58_9RHOB|nr:hypothetical protein [Rhodovulum euryhalinum]TCO69389.1 hypothetical protein EV655_11518 [Rhodovulum euryhalinum]
MKALETDPDLLRAEAARLSHWDGWARFVETYFDWTKAPERTVDQIEQDLQRPPVAGHGHIWEPFAGNYDVPPALEILFGQLSEEIFARLEPEAHRENLAHPERFGRKCAACRVFTRTEARNCAFCGAPLLRMPLSDD